MALNIFKLFQKKKTPPVNPSGEQMVPGMPDEGKTPAQVLAEGMVNVRDIIAPSAIEIDYSTLRIGNTYFRTIFVSGYPRFVGANWLSPIINFDHSLDLSMFYYPVKSKMILDDLRRKITELEATIMNTREKGKLVDPVVTAALEDANTLQEQLVKGVEKYFKFSFYINIPAGSLEELESVSARLESTLGSLLLISKVASLQMEDAFQSTIPCGLDKMLITRNMDTTSLATTFPFTSSDLTMEEGIMYGINKSNGSLIIFERFSLENANTVVFAKSGSGKSYFVKLEALRLMVFGAEVMIIDPEEEYRALCDAVGGNYIDFSANSVNKINPFDLSGIAVEGENELGQKLISLITLFKLMMGGMSSVEEALLDRALIETYRIKGISTDPETQMTKEPPVMEDLYKVLLGMDEPEARSMAERLEKFIKGSMTGIFDAQSNIDLESKMTVFSTKNLEEALRPIAFYMILDFIWTRIRRDLRKRILIVEEAWYLLQNEDSARFIYGIAKRARKYYLGLTTISQDVDDFLTSEYGKAIVTNSSIQVLFKQHPAAIDKVAETFYLSEGEKRLLLASNVGEGLFFAGSNHVAIRVMASDAEHRLITTNPEEILKLKAEGLIKTRPQQAQQKPTYRPMERQADPNKYTTFDASGVAKAGYETKASGQYQASPNVPAGVGVARPNVMPAPSVPATPAMPITPAKPQETITQTPMPPTPSISSMAPTSAVSTPTTNGIKTTVAPSAGNGNGQGKLNDASEFFEPKQPTGRPQLPPDYVPSADEILAAVNEMRPSTPAPAPAPMAQPKPVIPATPAPQTAQPLTSNSNVVQNTPAFLAQQQGTPQGQDKPPVNTIKDEMSAMGQELKDAQGTIKLN